MIRTRSTVVRAGMRAVTPLVVVLATYLLFAGHNQPGGGFAAGLVLGAAVTLRAVAGLDRPRNAVPLIGVGGIVVAGVALFPLLLGDPLADQGFFDIDLPVLGEVKSGSALIFDIGVMTVVVGLVVAVLEAFDLDRLGEDR